MDKKENFADTKTRHRKPFLGVCRRLTEKIDLRIAFFGIYAAFIKGTSPCFLREEGILAIPAFPHKILLFCPFFSIQKKSLFVNH